MAKEVQSPLIDQKTRHIFRRLYREACEKGILCYGDYCICDGDCPPPMVLLELQHITESIGDDAERIRREVRHEKYHADLERREKAVSRRMLEDIVMLTLSIGFCILSFI